MGLMKTGRLAAMQKQQRAKVVFRCLFYAFLSDSNDRGGGI